MPVIDMSGLDSYTEDGGNAQKQTHITFQNPDHEDYTGSYADDEVVGQHFAAANAIQSSALSRKMLVGDFLTAVQDEHINGNEGAISDFLESLEDDDESEEEEAEEE